MYFTLHRRFKKDPCASATVCIFLFQARAGGLALAVAQVARDELIVLVPRLARRGGLQRWRKVAKPQAAASSVGITQAQSHFPGFYGPGLHCHGAMQVT